MLALEIKGESIMPNWDEENKYSGLIAGIDEAGRGPWAGAPGRAF